MSDRNYSLPELTQSAATISSLVDYQGDSIVSKVILDRPTGNVTLFAFAAGQRLSEHTAPFDAVVQIIAGSAEIIIGGKTHVVKSGEIIIMPADIPHAVNAPENFKMLLTMIKN